MQDYYEKNDLVEFSKRVDPDHQLSSIMKLLGKNIISFLSSFHQPKKLEIINDNPKFSICTPKEMNLISGTLEGLRMQNSSYDERVFRLIKETKIQFSKEFEGYFVIGVYTWNEGNNKIEYSSLILENQKTSISKGNSCLNVVLEFHNDFVIDEQSYVRYDEQNDACFKEYSRHIPLPHKIKHCDIIAFFLGSDNKLNDKEDLEFLKDLSIFSTFTIELPKEYDFSHLIPPIEVYKEIIEEYCARIKKSLKRKRMFHLQTRIFFHQTF